MAAVMEKGVPFRFQASGASMSPFIRSGDIITIAPLCEQPSLGAVVAFVNPDNHRLAVHRIVACRSGSYLLRGDNGCHSDGWVAQGDIIGRVIRVEHKGRRMRLGLGAERVFIAALSRVGLLRLLLMPVYWVWRVMKKRV